MIPLFDNVRVRNLPFFTVLLIVVNVWVFADWQGGLHADPHKAVLHGAIPYEINHPGHQCLAAATEGYRCDDASVMASTYATDFPPTWETLFTSMFMHLTWWHLAGAMILLFVFGIALEAGLGGGGLLLFYAVGGLSSSLLHALLVPASPVPMIGATGAVAAVMGAYVVIYPRAKIFTWLLPPLAFVWGWVRAVWLALAMLLVQAVLVYFALKSTFGIDGRAAYLSHFGGFAAGAVLVWIVFDRKTINEHRRRARVRSGDEPRMFRPSDPVSTYRTFAGATAHARWVSSTFETARESHTPLPARRLRAFRRRAAVKDGSGAVSTSTRYPPADPFVPATAHTPQPLRDWKDHLPLKPGAVPRPPGC